MLQTDSMPTTLASHAPPAQRAYASVPDRLAALLVDALLLSALAFVAALVVGVVLGPAVDFHSGAGTLDAAIELDRGVATVDALVVAAIVAAYLMLSWRRGATPGQFALGLRVVAVDGGPIDTRAAILRWLGLGAPLAFATIVGTLVAGSALVVDLLAAVWYLLLLLSTARHPASRGWHDRLAGSVVTRAVRLAGSPAGEDVHRAG